MPLSRSWKYCALAALALSAGLVACSDDPEPACTPVEILVGDPASVPAPGWYSSDTRTNGTVSMTTEFGTPADLACDAVKLTTGEATGTPLQDKAQLFTFADAGTALSSVTSVSYWGYRSSTSPAIVADPAAPVAATVALNVQIGGAGVPGNFATLVYEPYSQAGGQAAILNDTWQLWDASGGLWWSTKNGQANLLTWADMKALYPDATVLGYGFNLGSNNPNLIVAGDGLTFGDTTTDF
jgi:hypothetical protein